VLDNTTMHCNALMYAMKPGHNLLLSDHHFTSTFLAFGTPPTSPDGVQTSLLVPAAKCIIAECLITTTATKQPRRCIASQSMQCGYVRHFLYEDGSKCWLMDHMLDEAHKTALNMWLATQCPVATKTSTAKDDQEYPVVDDSQFSVLDNNDPDPPVDEQDVPVVELQDDQDRAVVDPYGFYEYDNTNSDAPADEQDVTVVEFQDVNELHPLRGALSDKAAELRDSEFAHDKMPRWVRRVTRSVSVRKKHDLKKDAYIKRLSAMSYARCTLAHAAGITSTCRLQNCQWLQEDNLFSADESHRFEILQYMWPFSSLKNFTITGYELEQLLVLQSSRVAVSLASQMAVKHRHRWFSKQEDGVPPRRKLLRHICQLFSCYLDRAGHVMPVIEESWSNLPKNTSTTVVRNRLKSASAIITAWRVATNQSEALFLELSDESACSSDFYAYDPEETFSRTGGPRFRCTVCDIHFDNPHQVYNHVLAKRHKSWFCTCPRARCVCRAENRTTFVRLSCDGVASDVARGVRIYCPIPPTSCVGVWDFPAQSGNIITPMARWRYLNEFRSNNPWYSYCDCESKYCISVKDIEVNHPDHFKLMERNRNATREASFHDLATQFLIGNVAHSITKTVKHRNCQGSQFSREPGSGYWTCSKCNSLRHALFDTNATPHEIDDTDRTKTQLVLRSKIDATKNADPFSDHLLALAGLLGIGRNQDFLRGMIQLLSHAGEFVADLANIYDSGKFKEHSLQLQIMAGVAKNVRNPSAKQSGVMVAVANAFHAQGGAQWDYFAKVVGLQGWQSSNRGWKGKSLTVVDLYGMNPVTIKSIKNGPVCLSGDHGRAKRVALPTYSDQPGREGVYITGPEGPIDITLARWHLEQMKLSNIIARHPNKLGCDVTSLNEFLDLVTTGDRPPLAPHVFVFEFASLAEHAPATTVGVYPGRFRRASMVILVWVHAQRICFLTDAALHNHIPDFMACEWSTHFMPMFAFILDGLSEQFAAVQWANILQPQLLKMDVMYVIFSRHQMTYTPVLSPVPVAMLTDYSHLLNNGMLDLKNSTTQISFGNTRDGGSIASMSSFKTVAGAYGPEHNDISRTAFALNNFHDFRVDSYISMIRPAVINRLKTTRGCKATWLYTKT
jgi:hypothetical protein